MESTYLTLSGFAQPSVAHNLIELEANAEKGLSQVFTTLGQSPKVVPKIEFSPRDLYTYIYIYIYICMSHLHFFYTRCIGEITIMTP